jgi:hypothetical protein
VRNADYTLAVEEQMTLTKAKAFIARYGAHVAHAIRKIERELLAQNPSKSLHVRTYSADMLAQQAYQRTAKDYRIAAGHVSDIGSGGKKSIAVVVEWDTEQIIIVDGPCERRVSQ